MWKMVKTANKKKRIRNPVETRAKLLRATIELVSEKGADALSLKEAASRANVSRGVAYLHFEDRDQLLNEAKRWISEGLQDGVKRFDESTSMHDRTFYTTKLVLEHPEASRLMIADAMAGKDLNRQHPLYKLVFNRLTELETAGRIRAGVDLEILAYIHFGSIAATVMLGAQHKGEDLDDLSDRFTTLWNRIMTEGAYVKAKERSPKTPRTAPKKRRAGS
jgi:AcrR family transcriptional regulator